MLEWNDVEDTNVIESTAYVCVKYSGSHETLTHWGRDKMAVIFHTTFSNENVWIPIKISMKFVPKGPINNIPTLVPIMTRCRPGNKPLSEPMMVRLPTHICVSRPQWDNTIIFHFVSAVVTLLAIREVMWCVAPFLHTSQNGTGAIVCLLQRPLTNPKEYG